MSFVERNKAWILPLLAAGVAGVLYMDFRTTTTPPPPPPAPSPGANPAPAAEVAPSEPAPQPDESSEDTTLWADLKPYASVPQGLVQTDSMQAMATEVLPESILRPPPPHDAAFPVPPNPTRLVPMNRASHPGPQSATAPEPDFIIQGPEGRQAWFSGEGYREQQHLDHAPFRILHIGQDRVVLEGPAGSETRSTHPTGPQEAP